MDNEYVQYTANNKQFKASRENLDNRVLFIGGAGGDIALKLLVLLLKRITLLDSNIRKKWHPAGGADFYGARLGEYPRGNQERNSRQCGARRLRGV
ncbi:MAG TPA: hypothetical protein PLG84_03750 [Anaerolineaceae bacterium]|jgi:hypothetical protein|nr:hypothetical protein [Anaerolineaceae bacterium]HOE34131.1 hypothetical protein [Anaerolineaceae bacterium]HOT25128.1 hypothetical protein [Anaerolineaceae bacterium]HQH57940.1 hypothetical protein [Anaerolineaceae bacterium]HQK02811.1 hypothetical protein [Anaerolineaceae bacterium]